MYCASCQSKDKFEEEKGDQRYRLFRCIKCGTVVAVNRSKEIKQGRFQKSYSNVKKGFDKGGGHD